MTIFCVIAFIFATPINFEKLFHILILLEV